MHARTWGEASPVPDDVLNWLVDTLQFGLSVVAAGDAPIAAPASSNAVDQADVQDIQQTLNGMGAAYARLIERYQDAIGLQMWRFTRHKNVCDELVQTVFVEAYLGLAKYRGDGPFLHWLRRIAVRVGYRHWKTAARQRLDQPLSTAQAAPVASSQEEETMAREAGAQVHALLKSLPPRDRLVLTLLYLDGCTVKEAARLSGWSSTMVKVQAFRARKKLKQLLETQQLGDGEA